MRSWSIAAFQRAWPQSTYSWYGTPSRSAPSVFATPCSSVPQMNATSLPSIRW